jgi:hypothetical protein
MPRENKPHLNTEQAKRMLVNLRAAVGESSLAHSKHSIEEIYAMPLQDHNYPGATLGARWTNLLKEVLGEDNVAHAPENIYAMDEDGLLKLALRPTRETKSMTVHSNDIHAVAQPLIETSIAYKDHLSAKGPSVTRYILVDPRQPEFIEHLRAALIRKRDPYHENDELARTGTSELSPEAYRQLKRNISDDVERDLWGSAAKSLAR